MNIAHLMRSLITDARPMDAKALELKVGQIVRGLVLQLLENDEALLKIEGIQVRARLETPLGTGQTATLQVQPESSANQIILKPLEASRTAIESESLHQILRDFGIKNTQSHRQLVQLMHSEGVPLNK